MTPTEAIDFFGSRTELAAVCDVSQTAVHHWVRKGWIPYDKQCLIQLEAEKLKRRRGRGVPVASRSDIPRQAA